MRNVFMEELVLLAAIHENIALVVGDLGYSVIEPFADTFPDRFINAGVAEQNMMGLAAGMASEGYHVFTYSIANFPTFRCSEQIRNDIDYHNLPVTIVSVGGGLAYGALGYSHHAVQDYALVRCMPNMLIAAPGDPMEVRACMRYLVKNPQPSYLRLGKAGEPCYHQSPPVVAPGQWLKVADGVNTADACFLTTGTALEIAMNWRKFEYYRDHTVWSLPLWGMRWKNIQVAQLEKFMSVITLEDHLHDAGFGSWLMESIVTRNNLRQRLEIKALDQKVLGMVGSQRLLNSIGGISP